ncbi:MAG TPA: class I SAM-dependent methyltransferase [Solirubrobacteraceae bacterium]|nr:class I SAM-dependent methyltransferase [Solirubrobacteraceae bacterium]
MGSRASTLSAEEIRTANVRYHNVAADHYDAKWGISFDALGESQVGMKVRRALGTAPEPFGRALEIGSGTGYFSLNLLRAGLIETLTCTDIAPGMLRALARNARAQGLKVRTRTCSAEALPFAAESFDLVLGHAILHHIPDLARAFSEFERVLAPGGMILFAGEPSLLGDRIASVPKRGASRLAPLWRALVRARPRRQEGAHEQDATAQEALEGLVDVHAFVPGELAALAREAGFCDVRVRGEELLANWFGWTNRTLEASATPETVPRLWREYAYRGYLLLQGIDRALLEPMMPAGVFYNLVLCARKPLR